MSKMKIVFFDTKDFEEKYLLEHKIDDVEYIFVKSGFSECEELTENNIYDADIISVFVSSRVPGDILEKFKNLKLITTRSTGYNNVDTDYCKSKNISVVNVPSYGDVTVAEFAFGLLLNVARKINLAYQQLKEGLIDIKGNIGRDLGAMTIGVIGTGAIGRHAIKIAKGFGMNVVAYDPYPRTELEEQLGFKYVSLDDLYAQSDAITVHCPANPQTHHMINEQAFSKMKQGVIFINTARGEIVDTSALYKALRNGKVSGAGLDVLECENILIQEDDYLMKLDCVDRDCLAKTLINNKLLDLPNVIVTPHVAFDSLEAIYRILDTTIDNIKSFISGNIKNKVN